MTFALYVIGFLILIGGVSYGAYLMQVPPRWIVVADLVLLGLGVLTGAMGTRHRDPST